MRFITTSGRSVRIVSSSVSKLSRMLIALRVVARPRARNRRFGRSLRRRCPTARRAGSDPSRGPRRPSRRHSSTTSSSSWFHRISTRPRDMQTTLLLNTYHAVRVMESTMRSQRSSGLRVPHGCLASELVGAAALLGRELVADRRARTKPRARRAEANRSRVSFARPSASTRSTSAGSCDEHRRLRRHAIDDVVERRRYVFARERGVAGDRAIEDRGERVDVGAMVDVLAARLLGRHVGRCADDVALRQRAACRPALLTPKSRIFQRAVAAARNTLCGLRSRWTMPATRAASRPCAT